MVPPYWYAWALSLKEVLLIVELKDGVIKGLIKNDLLKDLFYVHNGSHLLVIWTIN